MINGTSPSRRVRVLIVEDSPTARQLLVQIFESSPLTEVAGVATDGHEAVAAVDRLSPDVVTMDIDMPRMDGFEATRAIMERKPTPIIIVSGSWDPDEVRTTFRAMEAGALAVMPRPVGPEHPNYAAAVRDLITTARVMSEVKLVRRWAKRPSPTETPIPVVATAVRRHDQRDIAVCAIGASTGGPMALHTILRRLQPGLPFPILVVQHMAAGFLDGFVDWLRSSTGMPVQVAKPGEQTVGGNVYVAPDDMHLGIGRTGALVLKKDPPDNGLRPSVAHLFRSVAASYGGRAVAILLTGMGTDGAAELGELRTLGALTIAQSKESSVVHGMPGEAQRLGAASWSLAPEAIADSLTAIASAARKP